MNTEMILANPLVWILLIIVSPLLIQWISNISNKISQNAAITTQHNNAVSTRMGMNNADSQNEIGETGRSNLSKAADKLGIKKAGK